MAGAVERPYHNDMKPRMDVSCTDGLTLLELVVVIAVCAVVAGLFLSEFERKGSRARSVACLGNLKFVVLAQTLWAHNRGEPFPFPFEVSASNGGLQEVAVERRDLASYYRALSNELGNPKVLACPADRQALPVTNFAMLTASGVSYFMNLDPLRGDVRTALHGDSKLSFVRREEKRITGLSPLTNGSSIAWNGALHGAPGKGAGNMGFADGSVERLPNDRLQSAFFAPENSNAPVRLLFP